MNHKQPRAHYVGDRGTNEEPTDESTNEVSILEDMVGWREC